MIITHAEAEGFGPFRQMSINLARSGITAIEGDIDCHGCVSNGAGKSMIPDLVSWVLYDSCLRDSYKGTDLIHEGAKFAMGRVTLQADNGDQWHVTRYMRHPQHKNQVHVTLNGEDATGGRNDTTQSVIDRVYMPKPLFVCLVAFVAGTNTKSFFAATDKERKAVLDQFLAVDYLSLAAATAKKEADRLRIAVDDVLSEYRRVMDALETVSQERETVPSKEAIKALKAAVTEASADVAKMTAARTAADDAHAQAKAAVDEAKVDYLIAYKANHAAQKALRPTLKPLEDAERKAGTAVKAAAQRVADLAEEIEDLEAAPLQLPKDGPSTCSACGQAIAAKDLSHVRKHKEEERAAELKALRAQLAEAKKAMAPANKTHAQAQAALVPVNAELRALEEAEPSEPDTSKLDAFVLEAAEALEEAEQDEERAEAALRAAEHAHLAANTQRTSWRDRLATAKAKLASTPVADPELQAELEAVEFWVEGFSDTGIKSLLLDTVIPEISATATQYGRQFLGDGVTIALESQTTLKSGAIRDKLDIKLTVPKRAKTYPGMSRGQRTRLDLAIMLALRSVAARRAKIQPRQLFVDELFDGLDPAGCHEVIAALNKLSQTEVCPVLLITHDKLAKGSADRVVVVRNRDGVAEVVDG